MTQDGVLSGAAIRPFRVCQHHEKHDNKEDPTEPGRISRWPERQRTQIANGIIDIRIRRAQRGINRAALTAGAAPESRPLGQPCLHRAFLDLLGEKVALQFGSLYSVHKGGDSDWISRSILVMEDIVHVNLVESLAGKVVPKCDWNSMRRETQT